MTLTDMLVPTFTQMLTALSAWLEKAEGTGVADLTAAKLAPDMFPLATQVRFACVQALEPLYRLRGEEFSADVTAMLNEGRNAHAFPGTLADARGRIAKTLALFAQLSADLPDVAPETPIAHTLPQGMVFDLTAIQYARDWALPQFYFHIVTAYALLRAQGVAVGKIDYVAHVLPHLRPTPAA